MKPRLSQHLALSFSVAAAILAVPAVLFAEFGSPAASVADGRVGW